MRLLVTGGSGQLGKEIRDILPDHFYIESRDYDLTEQGEVRNMYKDIRPDVVVHTAALVGEMTDHIRRPTEYLAENVKMNTFVVDEALKYGVQKLIAITSTGIYPDVSEELYPITENLLHNGPPTFGFFSYSIAKRTMAVHIEAIKKQYGCQYCHLAVGNMYGKHDRFDEKSHFIATLMKEVDHAIKNDLNYITLYGTGEPLRQFINASDVAAVIKLMIDNNIYESFNLTDDKNVKVGEVARLILDTLGFHDIMITYNRDKPDGQYRKDVSIERFRSFFPDFKFRDMGEGIKEMYQRNFK